MTGGPFIRSARLDKGLSIRAAAKTIGVTQDILFRAEKGSTPRPAAAKRIADFYDAKVTDIWPLDEKAAA